MRILAILSLATGVLICLSSTGTVGVVAFVPQTTTLSLSASSATATSIFVSNANNNDNNDSSNNEKGTAREDGKEESEEDFQRRMAVVRSLQMSFYGASASKPTEPDASDNSCNESRDVDGPPIFDAATGTVQKLPLFRASWYELPGRTNVLILRDPVYTNMFERIFYTTNASSDKASISPWVFGHLYTPNDNKKADTTKKPPKKQVFKSKTAKTKANSKKNQLLSTWKETSTIRANTDLASTSVLGTLMYVRDYRRLRDGRILALVQAAETFVVDNIRQTLPYSVIDAKLLPDVEELDLKGSDFTSAPMTSTQEDLSIYSCGDHPDEQYLVDCLRADEVSAAGPARTRAVLESIRRYNPYECDANQRLDGIPDKVDLSILDIGYESLSRVNMPYCPFSSNTTVATAQPLEETVTTTISNSDNDTSPSLEFQLLRKGITKIPPSDPRFSYNSEPSYSLEQDANINAKEDNFSSSWKTDELEYELWLVLDHFLVTNKKEPSPVLLALLPSDDQVPKAWPPDFSLKRNTTAANYPNRRRQRRLSYMAAYLLEGVLPIGSTGSNFEKNVRKCVSGVDEVAIQELRALLLSVPSTRQRLRLVLEKFHQWRLYQECDEFA